MKRLIVKVGTGNLVSKRVGMLDPTIFMDIARQISIVLRDDIEVAIVSSGAIKAGQDYSHGGSFSSLSKEAWAGVGARHLLNLWGLAFEGHDREIAQVWLTHSNWENMAERTSINRNIRSYMTSGIVPIINENDVVSDTEICLMDRGISENDRLARMVAELIKADAVLFLTDIGGIYDKNPVGDPSAKRLTQVNTESASRISASELSSRHGTGGIKPKLEEALICSKQGMRVAIAGLDEPNVILRFASGHEVGTMVE